MHPPHSKSETYLSSLPPKSIFLRADAVLRAGLLDDSYELGPAGRLTEVGRSRHAVHAQEPQARPRRRRVKLRRPRGLEFRLATDATRARAVRAVPPASFPASCRFPYGHTHERQEEIYVVVRGSGRMKLDDDIIDVGSGTPCASPPGTWRGYEAGPDGMEILVMGAPSLGDDRRDDVDGQRDWWTDDDTWRTASTRRASRACIRTMSPRRRRRGARRRRSTRSSSG